MIPLSFHIKATISGAQLLFYTAEEAKFLIPFFGSTYTIN